MLYAAMVEYARSPTSLVESQLGVSEFENFFKDSGYWDYALLSGYDRLARLGFVYSFAMLGGGALVEQAASRLITMGPWLSCETLFEVTSLRELFVVLLLILATMTAVLLWAASLGLLCLGVVCAITKESGTMSFLHG